VGVINCRNCNIKFLSEYSIENHKIKAMDEEKRSRLIQSAMQEFTRGYSLANTDEITRNAGISKGLLFHYFGSKRGLFLFLMRHALEVVMEEYLKVTFDSRDYLENLWKVSLKAQQLSFQYPVLYEFLGKVALSMNEVFPEGYPKDIPNPLEELMIEIYQNMDTSLFRDDIDVKKACDIINWAVKGYSDRLMTYVVKVDDYKECYEQMMRELEEYLLILRKAFYR
jgi:AcrR family transcriptional regulator